MAGKLRYYADPAEKVVVSSTAFENPITFGKDGHYATSDEFEISVLDVYADMSGHPIQHADEVKDK